MRAKEKKMNLLDTKQYIKLKFPLGLTKLFPPLVVF